MNLEGSATQPKGCPAPSKSIEYTVFVSLKAGRKVELEKAKPNQKWLIQGEIALDIPMDECPGEIGVIAFQIAPIEKQNAVNEPSPIEVNEEAAATIEASEDVLGFPTLALSQIRVPEKYEDAWLNPAKTKPVRAWIQKHGRLDKPVDVCIRDGEYWLIDGYRRYAIAKEEGFDEIPVRIVMD